MSIEITCPHCQSRLRVPDEAVGEQAKCPHCEQVFDVAADDQPPTATPVPDEPKSDPFAETSASDAYGSPHSPESNPYAAPLTEPTAGQEQEVLGMGRLDGGTAVQISWELFKANMPVLLLSNGVVLFICTILGSLGGAVQDLNNEALEFLMNVVIYAVQWFLSIGMTIVNLNVARGRPADVGMVFSGGPWFVRVAAATVMFSIAVTLGTLLFIIPGLYIMSRFWAYQCFIIDRDCGVMESFNLSGQYTEGNKMQAVVVVFLTIILAIVGALALCVGLLVAIPVITMTWVVAYLMITRQAIQRPA